MTNTDRRRLLAGLLTAAPVAAAALPAAASGSETICSAAGRIPEAWRELIKQCGFLHPQGHLAAIEAYRAGLDVADFSGIRLAVSNDGSASPQLTFGPWWDHKTPYHIVTPDSVGLYTPEPAALRFLERQKALVTDDHGASSALPERPRGQRDPVADGRNPASPSASEDQRETPETAQ